jgi:hypothetical protein
MIKHPEVLQGFEDDFIRDKVKFRHSSHGQRYRVFRTGLPVTLITSHLRYSFDAISDSLNFWTLPDLVMGNSVTTLK